MKSILKIDEDYDLNFENVCIIDNIPHFDYVNVQNDFKDLEVNYL